VQEETREEQVGPLIRGRGFLPSFWCSSYPKTQGTPTGRIWIGSRMNSGFKGGTKNRPSGISIPCKVTLRVRRIGWRCSINGRSLEVALFFLPVDRLSVYALYILAAIKEVKDVWNFLPATWEVGTGPFARIIHRSGFWIKGIRYQPSKVSFP